MSKKKYYDSWDKESFGANYCPSHESNHGLKEPKRLSCYETHPSLKFTVGGTIKYEIFGGSCSSPIVEDADIYIGFSSVVTNPVEVYPWEAGYKPIVVINYPIVDGMAPHNPESFLKLVEWTCNQLHQGQRIHAGCIGGHGRTGLFLAAVIANMTGMVDAIQYVRQNYCKKAVETPSQVNFLVEHFGVNAIEGTKKPIIVQNFAVPQGGTSSYHYNNTPPNTTRRIAPIKGTKLIW